MESFQKDAMSYRDIFPPDELFRSMYVVHAIFEYKKLARQSRRLSGVTKTGPEVSLDDPYSRARERALSLAVQALSDPEVTHASSNQNLRLSGLFMHMLVYWLQGEKKSTLPRAIQHSQSIYVPDFYRRGLGTGAFQRSQHRSQISQGTSSSVGRLHEAD